MFNCTYEFHLKKTNAAGLKVPYHYHTCFELVYYTGGRGYTIIDGAKFDYAANDIVIIEPKAQHNDVATEESNVICIGFSYDNAEFTLKNGVYKDKNKKISKLINMLIAEDKEKLPYFDFVCNAIISQIVANLGRSILPVNSDAVKNDNINRVLKYIDQYYLTEIPAEQLADVANYSYHRFRHVFKEKMGVSPKQYVLNKRLTYVKKQLQETDTPITELAYSCGFGSSSKLITLFKRAFGVSPLKYRKAHKTNSLDISFGEKEEKTPAQSFTTDKKAKL